MLYGQIGNEAQPASWIQGSCPDAGLSAQELAKHSRVRTTPLWPRNPGEAGNDLAAPAVPAASQSR